MGLLITPSGGGFTSPLTTKGDLHVYTTTDTRLAVGSNGTILIADSTAASGLAWKNGGANISAKVKDSATQNVNNATWTALTWDTELFDNGGLHSTVSNTSRFTIPTGEGGIYIVTANVQAEFADYNMGLAIYVNGAAVCSNMFRFAASGSGRNSISTILSLAAADYIEVYVYQDSGTARSFKYNSVGNSEFTIAKVP